MVQRQATGTQTITVNWDGEIERVSKLNNDLSSSFQEFDPKNTHPYNELDVTKGPDNKVTAAQIKLDPTLLAVGSTVGQIFGSELGAALGGKDQLTKQLGSVAGGTVGGLIGQKFVQVLATSMTADLSKVSLTDVFALKGVDIANAGVGAVSSFLTAELGSALNMHGFSGTLFNIAGGSLTFSVLKQVTENIAAGLTFDAAIGAINWTEAVSGAIDTAQLNFDGGLGGYLAHEFVPAKTHEGAVGGALLGAIGNIILPGGLGSFIGTVLGTLIGNAFGTQPSPGAVDLLDQAGYLYNYREYQTSDHGSYTAPDAMAPAADAIINAYLRAVNGVALDHSKQVIVGYIQNPDLLFLSGTPGHADHSFSSANDAVHAAALDVLQNTEVIGGDFLLKRAHHNSPSNDPAKAPAGSAGLPGQPQFSAAEQLVTMAGDLSIAQDYETYLNNREAINALIAASPNSAFTAGWIATFARVNDLKLNQLSPNDFLGGLVGYLDSVAKAGLGSAAANAAVSHGGVNDSVITVAVKASNGADVPGSLAVFADLTTVSSDAGGQTAQLQFGGNIAVAGFHRLSAGAVGGDGARDLWFGGDGGQTFNGAGGHDILVGGAGNDVIHGGAGWDFVDGGAGIDYLFGDDGNDILRGGRDADFLYGGAGNDTYAFNRGDGADTATDHTSHMESSTGGSAAPGSGGGTPQEVHDNGGVDTVAFGAGIRITDIAFQSVDNDLVIGLNDPAHPGVAVTQLADRITLKNWAVPDALDRIENISFADGSTFSIAGIINHRGTAAADTLTWTDSAAWLDGGLGNDTLTSGSFNDVLRGGPGDDVLNGGAGFDTALFDGLSAAYTLVSYNGTVAALSHGGADGSDRLQGIETLQFADRSVDASSATTFDPLAYIASYADLITAFGVNPQAGFAQYVGNGFAEGRAISFDPFQYVASNPADLIAAIGLNVAAAEQHYIVNGYYEHRPVHSFDPFEYLASNPDLIVTFGLNPLAGEQHFITNGYYEGRPSHSFDAIEYIASNPDLITAFGFNAMAGEQHYIAAGYAQHRATASFDAVEYIASNPDLIVAFGFNPLMGERHYVESGFNEHRATASFDAAEYIASNPDLIVTYGYNLAAGEQHYIGAGYAQGRPTHSFDAAEYIASNPDLIVTYGYNLAAGEQHYIGAGYAQGRPTHSFDAVQYLANYADLAAAFGNNAAIAEQHYIQSGYYEGRTDKAPVVTGDAGDNTLAAANGAIMTGGGGADNFAFSAALTKPAVINDFTAGVDHLQISAAGFGHGLVAAGTAPLVTAATAASASHAGGDGYFIFDNANTVWWDPTGGSGADAVALAKLTGLAALHASDFLLA